MVINQRYTTGYKPENYLVVAMDTDEDQDTMNSDDATAKTNIELDHNYALQPSQFPHPQPPPQHIHIWILHVQTECVVVNRRKWVAYFQLQIITNLQIFHMPELLLYRFQKGKVKN